MTYSLHTLSTPTSRTASAPPPSGSARLGQELGLLLGLATLVFCVLALLSYSSQDPAWTTSSERVAKERQKPLFVELPDSKLPQVDLLDGALQRQETVAPETLEMTSRLIEKKLKDFGVEVRVVLASPGPVITRYEIEPATGVKGSQIVNLAKDLARSR
jgi:DNA segregation ATPase FtsK/SpoIIIE-like protein